MARGKRSTTASTAGARMAPGPRSSTPSSCAWIRPALSSATCGWWTPRSSGAAGRQPARKKKLAPPPLLAGPEALRLEEPSDHALGRSQGGFGTKVHLVTDGQGTVLAVWVTPGQRHESQAFAVVMLRAKRPRRAGRRRWPKRVAGDKGYSYDGIRQWLRRRHIEPVIPTRKDQPPDGCFDPQAYRRRSRIEQVVGWYKECRALGTRYDKLAVNYVALWLIASIEKLLRKYSNKLKTGLSERA